MSTTETATPLQCCPSETPSVQAFHNEGDHVAVDVECQSCGYAVTEQYPYRRTINTATGEVVKVRGDGTINYGCCPREKQVYEQTGIEKQGTDTVVVESECQNCATVFEDEFVYAQRKE